MKADENELKNIINELKGTYKEEILKSMQKLYSKIAKLQASWYEKSGFTCVKGCGECCRNFEPDLLECESIFMAAWLLENQREVADNVIDGKFPFPNNKGCPFWDEQKEYHCTIYGGRPFICRFFGACGSKGKDEKTVFKPCKFYPAKILEEHNPPLAHKQYSDAEIMKIFGILPPVTTDIMESAVSLNPNNHSTELLRTALPKAIKELKWICKVSDARILSD